MKKIITLLLALSYSVQSLCIPGLKKAMATKTVGLEAALEEKTTHKYADLNSTKELPDLPTDINSIILVNYLTNLKNIKDEHIDLALDFINNHPENTNEILQALEIQFNKNNLKIETLENRLNFLCKYKELKGIKSFDSFMQNNQIGTLKNYQTINKFNALKTEDREKLCELLNSGDLFKKEGNYKFQEPLSWFISSIINIIEKVANITNLKEFIKDKTLIYNLQILHHVTWLKQNMNKIKPCIDRLKEEFEKYISEKDALKQNNK